MQCTPLFRRDANSAPGHVSKEPQPAQTTSSPLLFSQKTSLSNPKSAFEAASSYHTRHSRGTARTRFSSKRSANIQTPPCRLAYALNFNSINFLLETYSSHFYTFSKVNSLLDVVGLLQQSGCLRTYSNTHHLHIYDLSYPWLVHIFFFPA